MNPGKRDEARKTVEIKESLGFTHPCIVTSFPGRGKFILAYKTRGTPRVMSVKLPTRFPEEPTWYASDEAVNQIGPLTFRHDNQAFNIGQKR
jgi:hypothetical protein